ncbi:MAG: hypothetical protein ABIR26_12410 [Ramlibacter sp.]
MAELMYKIANEEAPDIRIVRKDISERLANIVALSLSKRSETRYQDGDQFAADLRSALAEMTGTTTVALQAAAKGVVLRPDDEVNKVVSEKTVAFTAPGAARPASPAAADNKTFVMAPPPPATAGAVFEATVVGMPPGADNFEPTMAGVKPPAASDFAPTMPFKAPLAQTGYEPTVVGLPPMPPAAQGYEDTVIGMPPGYDATQKSDGEARGALDKTASKRPGEPGSPASGDGKTDLKA